MLCMKKKPNIIPLLTLRYFVLLLIPAFFFKIYPYLTTKYPLLGEHTSPQIRAKNDIVNGDDRVRASSMARFSRIFWAHASKTNFYNPELFII